MRTEKPIYTDVDLLGFLSQPLACALVLAQALLSRVPSGSASYPQHEHGCEPQGPICTDLKMGRPPKAHAGTTVNLARAFSASRRAPPPLPLPSCNIPRLTDLLRARFRMKRMTTRSSWWEVTWSCPKSWPR